MGFALAWYLAKETGSASVLATAMLVNLLPMIVLGPFIGPFIDRWNRKKIMIFSDLFTALLTLALVILFRTDNVQVWHIYMIMAGRAVSGAFQFPALNASIPMIVPEKHLMRANGLNRTLAGIVSIVGPPAGAFLMSTLTMPWLLSVDIFTAIVAISCLLPLVIPQPSRIALTVKFNVIGDMMQGFRYVISWKGLLYLVILCSILNFFLGPLNALLPLFVTNYLGGDVLKLGWLETSLGAGIIAGGLILNVWSGFKRSILTCFMGLCIWSVSIVILSFTTERLFFMGLAMGLFAGLGNTIFNGPMWAIMQKGIARDIQGRVFTLTASLAGVMVLPSLAITGPIAGAFGVRAIFFISGAAMLLMTILAFFSRDLMTLEDQKPGEDALISKLVT